MGSRVSHTMVELYMSVMQYHVACRDEKCERNRCLWNAKCREEYMRETNCLVAS